MTRERSEVSESLDADERDIPFLPTLLQDLWALGFAPDPTLELLRRNGLGTSHGLSMLDLGCGKGCALVRLAEAFGWHGQGVDLVPEFIEEARRRAKEAHVSDRVRFEVRGIAEEVCQGPSVDLVLFGFDAEVLGPLREALVRIQSRMAEGSRVILDSVWSNGRDPKPEWAITEAETKDAIQGAGLTVLDQKVLEPPWVRDQNRANTERIRRRAEELGQRLPEKRSWFDDYVRRQEEESLLLEESLDCVILLLGWC